MTILFSFLLRQLLKLDKARHPWVRRLAILSAIIGWLSRRFGQRSQAVQLRKGEKLVVSIMPKKDRLS